VAKDTKIRAADARKDLATAIAAKDALNDLTKSTDEYNAALKRQLEAELAVAKYTDGGKVDKILEAEKALNIHTAAMEKNTKAQAAAKKAQDDFSSALGNTIKTFTGVTDASSTLIGSFSNLAKESKGMTGVVEKAQEVFSETFTSLNIGVSIVQKVVQSTIAMARANDQALASFNKTTGAAGHYNKELLSLERGNRLLGISTAEMGESYSALISGVSGFGVMAQSERERVGELTAQFGKMGIATNDVVGTIESMTRGFGMSTTAATDMVEESRLLAQALGMNVGEVVADLNQALPKLASYGDDVTHIFKDLERQSQRTGFEVGELIDIAGQYRTFDSAADAAGNLNAVLGTQVFSTMGMLEANLEGPEELIRYMTDNLHDSIGDWDTLNTYQKDAVANAANMTTEQMNQLMNQRNMTQEDKDRQTSQQEAMKTARSMGEEFKILMAEFAVSVQPIFESLKSIVGFFSMIMQKLGSLGNGFVQIGAMIGTYLIAKFVIMAVKTKIQNSLLLRRIPIIKNIAAEWEKVAKAKQKAARADAGGVDSIGSAVDEIGAGVEGVTDLMDDVSEFASSGLAGKLSLATMGIGGAMGMFDSMADEGSGFSKEGIGQGAASGAMLGASIGSVIPGVGTAIGGAIGGIGGGLLSYFADGTDSTPQGPAIVGERGPELLVPPPGSAVVNNSSMTALAKGGGGNNAAVVAAVQALGSKLDAVVSALNASGDFVMQIDEREFGRVMNNHLGEPGYQKIDLRTA
tara:strand:- start:5614 stop:7866 length:2253 start_codon:yes stop_codon:yes gene_type:complete